MTKLIIPVFLTMLVMPALSQTTASQKTAELERRARRGDAVAQATLGSRYFYGDGVLEDYLEAVKWYRTAAEQGNPRAQFSLGRMYLYGRGVPINNVQAHMWCNLAASKLTGEGRGRAVGCRDGARTNLSTEEINEAQRLARQFKPKTWEVIRQELKIGPPE